MIGYGDNDHVHAATQVNGVQRYEYDASGNAITRDQISLEYDAENRLTRVANSQGTLAAYYYNGDGVQVRTIVNNVTTSYVGNYFEWKNSAMTKYYFAGSQRIAVRVGNTASGTAALTWLLSDHLGSTTETIAAGDVWTRPFNYTKLNWTLYKPWGQTRFTSGSAGTDYLFTGQRSESRSMDGVYFFKARFYDSLIGRFLSPDSIIPPNQGTQGFDRYAFVSNNAVNRVDPTGHMQEDPREGDTNPVWILENVHDDIKQAQMLVGYMYNHPDYNPAEDQNALNAGYDMQAYGSAMALEKAKADILRASFGKGGKDLLRDIAFPALVAGFILSGGPGEALEQLNSRMGINFPAQNMKSGGSVVSYTNQMYRKMQKDVDLRLTANEADALVILSREHGIEPMLDSGENHLDPNWNMPHLHFPGQGRPHVRVPDDYTLPSP